jgi:predicted restriction endonuclease
LLCANLDTLFDRGLITFEDNGDMRVSADLTWEQPKALGLPMSLCM